MWCKILDEKWAEYGFCVGAIDIDSDSYVMFFCKREILKKTYHIRTKSKSAF